MSDDPVLRVEDLRVGYRAGGADVEVVSGVSFELARGEALGLAGESACGKTATALALVQMLPAGLQRLSGTIDLAGEHGTVHVHQRTERGMRELRAAEISLLLPDALDAFDPRQRVSRQIAEAIRLHDRGTAKSALRVRAAELLERVGIGAALADGFPHELSGSQRQRALLALALACDPQVVIADEPTAALDLVAQAQVLALLAELRHDLGVALLLISHDLGVIAETCDRVAVMYAGGIVETGPVDAVFGQPQHPYTQRLLGAFPRIGGERTLAPAIPGAPPDPADPPSGCRFHPRCHLAREVCALGEMELRPVGDEHGSACLFAPLTQAPAGAAVLR